MPRAHAFVVGFVDYVAARTRFRRVSWSLGDQVLSSLTNFALNILVARSTDPSSFGLFSLVFVLYVLALGIVRSVVTEPLFLRFGHASKAELREAFASATGAAVVVGLLVSIPVLVAGLLLGHPFRNSFLALGVVLPGLLLQDAWRFCFLAVKRPNQAFFNDAAWAALLIPVFTLNLTTAARSPTWMILSWGTVGTIAGLIGIAQARLVPKPKMTKEWLMKHFDLTPAYLGDFIVGWAGPQVALFFAGAFGGLLTVGALRAGQIVLGPLTVMFLAVRSFALAEGPRLLQHSPKALNRFTFLMASALTGVSVFWTLVLYFTPNRFGEALLGLQWHPARHVLLPVAFWWILGGVAICVSAALRTILRQRDLLRVRLTAAPLMMAGGTLGALVAGASGAAWAMAMVRAAETAALTSRLMTHTSKLIQDGPVEVEIQPPMNW